MQNNSYVICREPSTTATIFERLSNGGAYWERLGEQRIVGVRDLTTGVDTRAADGRAALPLAGGYMLTYTFENGASATVRGSGTEPKIKFYVDVIEAVGAGGVAAARARATSTMDRLAAAVMARTGLE